MGTYDGIDFNDEEIEAASHWYGGQGSMLYAISSTGSLKRGTIRPRHSDGTPMTDDEWIVDLAERLESEAEEAARDAAKQAKKAKRAEREELEADQDGLKGIAYKASAFIREHAQKKPSHEKQRSGVMHATRAKKKTPAQLDREIADVLATPAVKCPSPEHPLYPELRRIRQVAHDTSWTASQLAKDAEEAFRSGDCEKAATMLEAAKRVIAKERRKRPSSYSTKRHHATSKTSKTSKTSHPGKYLPGSVKGGKPLYVVTVPPTREMGSYKTRVRGPMDNARRDALWDYNSARDHDGLEPVDRMPSGTKYTKEG